MTITAQRLLTELGSRAWSGFNIDDMIFNSEDSKQAKTELNIALRYLINLVDFPFRSTEIKLNVSENRPEYVAPIGQILSIYNAETYEKLAFIGDKTTYDENLTGTPNAFWITSKNPIQKIRLFPIPDESKTYKMVYNQYKPVISVNNSTEFEFTNENDYLNLPESLEFLFMDCLILRTMITNNKDNQDENYQPMIDEFNQAWKVFINASRPVRKDTMIVW